MNNSTYNPILSSEILTLVSEFIPTQSTRSSAQSEAELEKQFINQLKAMSYEYLEIHNQDDLKKNLRIQLESLNNFKFSDNDWELFYRQYIANPEKGILEKTELIQSKKPTIDFRTSDSKLVNIKLFDKENIYLNKLQVINQYETTGKHDNRYDVTILVNGLPLVHCELKARGRNIKEAFNQINRYGKDSFWAGDALFEYIQLFIISNGTETLYYSNTVRMDKVSGKVFTRGTFEFTNNWADLKNNKISDLIDFTKSFLEKRTLLNILAHYCVFDTRKQLKVMRPYQIAATEACLSKINIALKNNLLGSKKAGGYIWHTTGSGKTLTSFKLAQLACENPDIDKVFFVVDRKDLDYQTIQEYNRFEEGCVTSNKSTLELEKQINNPERKIIVTTIQKLNSFLRSNEKHPIYSKKVVMAFDECHRSQFGDMHDRITSHFKKYIIFGFTGTPIQAVNAKLVDGSLRTTEEIFGSRLHEYNIVNAINDGKVLPFRVEYVNTMKEKENIKDTNVYDINTKEALLSDNRIKIISEYIKDHYNQKTHNKKYNSILACDSIEFAKKYYLALKDSGLKIGLIYSYASNGDDNSNDGIDDENNENADSLNQSDRDFLEDVIKDYNKLFGKNFDTGSKFQAYYKDLSNRVKNKEIDILIVVNMFLTGFDAPDLNTLWVDKNLKYHGLIQAFSRTNRIKDSIKVFGNIVCFRNIEERINEAVALYSDNHASGIIMLKPYVEYYREYKQKVDALKTLPKTLLGATAEKTFISTFGKILQLENILSAFDEFSKDGQGLINDYDKSNYQSIYLSLKDKYRKRVEYDSLR